MTPSLIVLHYTGMPTAAEALARMCNAEARVSAHYMVEEDGAVHALVAEEKRAWHAGVSQWGGQYGVNDVSVGIEIVNPGHEFGYRPFPEEQIVTVTALCRDIAARWCISPKGVVAHSDIAPARKEDPGELFPWGRLAASGVGVWHGDPPSASSVDGMTLETRLARFGYRVGGVDRYEATLEQVIAAFQRRFRPSCIDGIWDADCEAQLNALLARGG